MAGGDRQAARRRTCASGFFCGHWLDTPPRHAPARSHTPCAHARPIETHECRGHSRVLTQDFPAWHMRHRNSRELA
eukprot:scaffold33420_cov36-Tisochrysis_lutea.AAC.3